MKTLVTGGSGFIGSALVKRLVKHGHDVTVFDNFSRGSKSRLNGVLNNVNLVNGDIRNYDEVLKAVKSNDNIFHLAFINGTKFFYEKPKLVLDVGIRGALNTIEASLASSPRKYIIASSSEVYHKPSKIPTEESERALIPDVTNPRYSYGGGKLISELMTINYFKDSKIQDCIFRPHNVFGPNMGFEHVIPDIMKKIFHETNKFKQKEIDLIIQGDGTDTRAFCYVEDAIDQIMTIYNNGVKSNIYHVGMNNERSIKELIIDIGKLLNIKINIVAGEKPKGGTSRRCPSTKKVISLGYKNNDNYLSGLDKTVNWYKNYYSSIS